MLLGARLLACPPARLGRPGQASTVAQVHARGRAGRITHPSARLQAFPILISGSAADPILINGSAAGPLRALRQFTPARCHVCVSPGAHTACRPQVRAAGDADAPCAHRDVAHAPGKGGVGPLDIDRRRRPMQHSDPAGWLVGSAPLVLEDLEDILRGPQPSVGPTDLQAPLLGSDSDSDSDCDAHGPGAGQAEEGSADGGGAASHAAAAPGSSASASAWLPDWVPWVNASLPTLDLAAFAPSFPALALPALPSVSLPSLSLGPRASTREPSSAGDGAAGAAGAAANTPASPAAAAAPSWDWQQNANVLTVVAASAVGGAAGGIMAGPWGLYLGEQGLAGRRLVLPAGCVQHAWLSPPGAPGNDRPLAPLCLQAQRSERSLWLAALGCRATLPTWPPARWQMARLPRRAAAAASRRMTRQPQGTSRSQATPAALQPLEMQAWSRRRRRSSAAGVQLLTRPAWTSTPRPAAALAAAVPLRRAQPLGQQQLAATSAFTGCSCPRWPGRLPAAAAGTAMPTPPPGVSWTATCSPCSACVRRETARRRESSKQRSACRTSCSSR